MPKDKKRDKEDELYLANLKGRVRVQEILRRLGLSSVEADLATESLDDMISQAVSEIAKSNAAAQRTFIWGVTIIGTLIAIVAVIVAIGTWQLTNLG